MAKIGTGVGGSITYANGYTTHVDTWTLSGEADEHDLTDFDNVLGWRDWIAGLTSWSGTYTAFVSGAVQLDANIGWFGGVGGAVTLDMDATRMFTGAILITGFTVDTATADIVKATFTFRGDGLLTVV